MSSKQAGIHLLQRRLQQLLNEVFCMLVCRAAHALVPIKLQLRWYQPPHTRQFCSCNEEFIKSHPSLYINECISYCITITQEIMSRKQSQHSFFLARPTVPTLGRDRSRSTVRYCFDILFLHIMINTKSTYAYSCEPCLLRHVHLEYR
jgi:hypothetical protein